jgi:hypothetical protein
MHFVVRILYHRVHSNNQSANHNTEICRLVEGDKAEVYTVVIILAVVQIATILATTV